MRCSCCDVELSPAEETAKFIEADPNVKPHRFVDMCRKCRSFLPPSVKYVSRPEAPPPREVNEDADELTDWERMQMRDYGEWEDS